jgi:antitoxin component of RelBE/YafQ-DinJ toxin-antitoxin module
MEIKEDQLKILVPGDLKAAFEVTCKTKDLTMSQVLRAFMKEYVRAHGEGQMEMFARGTK